MVDLFQTIIPPPATVADIGSGTGILTRQLLDAGYELFAVEPNKAMRGEAEQALSSYPGFHSMPGAGESTTLGARSIALITCAQAFHWLDREKTRVEFSRILEAKGVVALIWNERLDTASLFNREYADLL